MIRSITIVFLFLIPFLSGGQSQVGLKGGYTYYSFIESDVYHSSTEYDYSHNAFLVAVSFSYKASKIFYPEVEIQYSNRSFGVRSSEYGLAATQVIDYYITIGNLFFQLKPELFFGSEVKFFVYPGLYLGTLIHSSLSGTMTSFNWMMGNNPPHTSTIDGSAKGSYASFEIGIMPGLGLQFPVYKNLDFTLELNYSLSLSPVNDGWGGSDNIRIHSMNLEIGFAYSF